MFEILEHTADIGFTATGSTIEEMFAEAGKALVSIWAECGGVRPDGKYPLAVAGDDLESSLVNWLNEILFYLDARQAVIGEFQVEIAGPHGARGFGLGETRDPARHPMKVIVKAATYHLLKIEPVSEGWQCRVFLDI